jgi:hypothetical protein
VNRLSKLMLTLSVVGGLFLCTEGDAQAFVITWGDDIKDVGEIQNRPSANIGAPSFGPNERVGYVCQGFGVLWIFDIWSWGGQWCTYEGDTYYEIDEATAAFLLGIDESELSKPFFYSFPLGLICLILFVGFAIVGSIFGDPDDGMGSAQAEHDVSAQPEWSSGATHPVTPQGMGHIDNFNEGFVQPVETGQTQSFAQPSNTPTETTGSPGVESGVQIGQSDPVDNIYVMKRGKKFGPMSMDQLTGLIQKGQITSDDQFWADGMAQWQAVATLLQ